MALLAHVCFGFVPVVVTVYVNRSLSLDKTGNHIGKITHKVVCATGVLLFDDDDVSVLRVSEWLGVVNDINI